MVDVLIADDDLENGTIIADYLQFKNLSSHLVGSGDEAISWLKENDCKLILTDIRMPNGSGIDLMQWNSKKGKKLPIFAMSGTQDHETEQFCEILEIEFYAKPLELHTIVENINNKIQQSQRSNDRKGRTGSFLKRSIKKVMLIDDCIADNFLHQVAITNSDQDVEVKILDSASAALRFLSEETLSENKPDVIFLDLQMPEMNGWDFIKIYERLQSDSKNKTAIVILSGVTREDDKERALENKHVHEIIEKPLTTEKFQAIATALSLRD